jgi:exonuclease SbcC
VILRRLRVHPFGRFADREVAFAPGLTVILGPNEAGKSTLLEAVKAALFVPAKLSKAKFQEYLGRFVPVDGGDVVRADIVFAADGGEFVLARRWGTDAGSELRQPRGGPLADEKAITERVAGLLPASPRTMVTVLVVGQSDLGDTIAALGGKGELDDVSALLRRVVQETGGVSVDVVRRRLAETAAGMYGRWDRTRGAPEKGRGIENPWRNEVGDVLAAWYAADRLRVELANARAYERDLDELSRKIEAAGFVAERERFPIQQRRVPGRRERRVLEAQLAVENEKRAQLVRDTDEWPVREAEQVRLDGEIAAAEARLPGLVAEQRAAEAEESGRSLREKAGRVQRLGAKVAEAEAAIAAGPKIERAALAGIQAAHLAVERAKATAAASRCASRPAPPRIELRRDGGPIDDGALPAKPARWRRARRSPSACATSRSAWRQRAPATARPTRPVGCRRSSPPTASRMPRRPTSPAAPVKRSRRIATGPGAISRRSSRANRPRRSRRGPRRSVPPAADGS